MMVTVGAGASFKFWWRIGGKKKKHLKYINYLILKRNPSCPKLVANEFRWDATNLDPNFTLGHMNCGWHGCGER